MQLRPTKIAGAFVVAPEPATDERGFFARVFDAAAFAQAGLEPAVAECSIAFNDSALTLRGLHFQVGAHAEAKLVRCVRGAVFDVVVDLRADSPSYLTWDAVRLDQENRLGLYVPPGAAHGYLTLEDSTELVYQISRPYAPQAASGVRWDDPAFGIAWPAAPRVVSQRDATFPDYVPVAV
jgi:dTDP-4-dehydrorhamnose 3,5-epimerase